MFVLLTRLRKMDAATVRWEHIDLDARTLRRPSPKGGKERVHDPLSSECVRILARREGENLEVYSAGDGGWAFPTRAIKDREGALCEALGLGKHKAGGVCHVLEGKQQR